MGIEIPIYDGQIDYTSHTCDSNVVIPKSPNSYNGIDLCIPDIQLSDSQKRLRCTQVAKYTIYVATFFNDTVHYIKCKLREMYTIVRNIEDIQYNIEADISKLEGITENCVIPENITYNKEYIDNVHCGMMNDLAWYLMEKKDCCCTPYIKLEKAYQ